MFKIYVLLGKTGVGKSTIYQSLKNLITSEDNIKELLMYTTRPIRHGEKDGVDYNFINDYDISNLILENKLAEHRTFKTASDEVWFYATPKCEENGVYILSNSTSTSCMSLIELYGRECVEPIFITCDEYTRLSRLLEREHKGKKQYNEMIRRINSDNLDYDNSIMNRLKISNECSFDNSECYIDNCVVDIYNYIKK